MVCYDWTIFENLESEEQKNLNIEKIIFKVVQMKFLAMHITNQKLSWYIYGTKYLNIKKISNMFCAPVSHIKNAANIILIYIFVLFSSNI